MKIDTMDELHIIFTDEQVLVSKKAYASWQEVQAEFDDYKASLGPWGAATTMSWLEEEYDLAPSAEGQIASLLSSDQTVRTISFATKYLSLDQGPLRVESRHTITAIETSSS